MQTATWSRSRWVQVWGALAVLTCLLLATCAGLALGRTQSCARISNCSTRVVAPPPPQSTLGTAPSTGHFAVAVRTPPTSTLTTGRQPGTLIAKPQPAVHLRCAGYQLKDPTPLVFMLQTATPVNITYEITDRLTNTTADAVHFCLAATASFRTLSHRPAATTKLPDGTSGHIGLLPNCPKPLPPAGATTAPCVASVSTVPDSRSTTKVDVIMKVRVPTRTKGTTQATTASADPWGGG
jgi:hypothetical protein